MANDEELYQQYLKETGQDKPNEDALYQQYLKETGQANKDEGILSKAADVGGSVLSGIGTAVDYTVAPVRQAMMAPARISQGEIVNAVTAPFLQLLSGPSSAPSSSQVAEAYGVPKEKQVSPIVEAQPMYAASSYENNPLPNDPENVTIHPSEQAGGLIDLASGEGLGLMAKSAGKIVKGAKGASEALAIKQSGGMLKDFRRLEKTGKFENVGQSLLKEKVNIDGKSVPLMKAGDTVENIAEKANIKHDEVGKELGTIYDHIDTQLANPEKGPKINAQRFDPSKNIEELRSTVERNVPKAGRKQVMNYVDGIIDDVIKDSGNSLNDTQAVLGDLQNEINYTKAVPEMSKNQKALVEMQRYIREKQNNYVEAASDALGFDTGKKVRELNKQYNSIGLIKDTANDMVQRYRANQTYSLGDKMATAAGAAASGGVGAIASGGANYLARTRGAGVAAKGAEALSKAKIPSQESARVAGGLIETANNRKKKKGD